MRQFLGGFVVLALPGVLVADPHICHRINPNDKPELSVEVCTELLETKGLERSERDEALTNRGIAFRELGDFQRSILDLKLSVSSSRNTFTMRMLAWTYREAGDLEAAERLYTEVLAEDDHPQGWLSRCVVRQDMERYQDALGDCKQALRREGDNLDTVYFTARAFSFLDQSGRALPLTEQGMSLAPHDPRHLTEHVWALHQLGRTKEARQKARAGLERFPEDPDLLSFLEQSF
ncbi:tetratricopeptide repeat protein [Aestuariibius insulae]|uniref:tetratricopeptide repeat protein n=1 Tax=Aestuariibius insulae TaxID=2058287 RepID=UPI00345E75F0